MWCELVLYCYSGGVVEEVALLSNVISQIMGHTVVVVVGPAGGVAVVAIMVGGDAPRILDEVVEHPPL